MPSSSARGRFVWDGVSGEEAGDAEMESKSVMGAGASGWGGGVEQTEGGGEDGGEDDGEGDGEGGGTRQ
jgi:hypothetical protein